MTPRFRRHRNQSGQTVPILAIAGTVLLAFTAIATDLSLQTHERRTLQNADDAAALGGAQQLGVTASGFVVQPTAAERVQGATIALEILHNQLYQGDAYANGAAFANAVFSSPGSKSVSNGCSTNPGSTTCDLYWPANCDNTTGANPCTVEIHSPPLYASNTSYDRSATDSTQGQFYFEVISRRSTANGFGSFVGSLTSVDAGHAVAYHLPGHQPVGFALYSGSVVQSGNQGEIIDGPVYSARDIQPQDSSTSDFMCSDDSGSQPGVWVLGGPQAPNPLPSPDPLGGLSQQRNIKPTNAQTLSFIGGTCAANGATMGGGNIYQSSPAGCPSFLNSLDLGAYTDSGAGTGNTGFCVANGLPLPSQLALPAPTGPTAATPQYGCGGGGLVGNVYQPGEYTCGLTVDHPLAPGVYFIKATGARPPSGADLVIDGHSAPSNCNSAVNPFTAGFTTCLLGVTIYLEANGTSGATMMLDNKALVVQTAYDNTSSTNSADHGVVPVYAPGVGSLFDVKDIGTTYQSYGSFFVPNGTVASDSNAILNIQGQAIVDSWQVQSGNHTNPLVTYNASRVASLIEILRLVT